MIPAKQKVRKRYEEKGEARNKMGAEGPWANILLFFLYPYLPYSE